MMGRVVRRNAMERGLSSVCSEITCLDWPTGHLNFAQTPDLDPSANLVRVPRPYHDGYPLKDRASHKLSRLKFIRNDSMSFG